MKREPPSYATVVEGPWEDGGGGGGRARSGPRRREASRRPRATVDAPTVAHGRGWDRRAYRRRGFFFAGPFASRSASSSTARSIVRVSAASDFGTVAFVVPSATYAP